VKFMEVITIIPPAIDIARCRRMLTESKVDFEFDDDWFRFHGEYTPGRYEYVIGTLSTPDRWEVRHSVYSEYSKKDIKDAALIQVVFPDCHGIEVPWAKECSICNRIYCKPSYGIVTNSVQCTHNVANWGYGGVIVKSGFAKSLATELRGIRFFPFDKEGRYLHLAAKTSLGSIMVNESEYIGYTGTCSECRIPKYKMFFGPLRYSANAWNKDDVVVGGLFNGPIFSQKALNMLKAIEPCSKAMSPVILE
jgi:hypothetical protein